MVFEKMDILDNFVNMTILKKCTIYEKWQFWKNGQKSTIFFLKKRTKLTKWMVWKNGQHWQFGQNGQVWQFGKLDNFEK